MKTVVIGSDGQLGSDLIIELESHSDVIGLTHRQIEITNIDSVNKVFMDTKPDIVINTAAFHNVPLCETNPTKSFEVNSVGPFNLAKVCSDRRILLIHYSTDYVFDGEKSSPYSETDIPNPLNIYGASKLAGEQIISNYSDNYIIIRISGIYGRTPCRAKGGNFIYNILKASKEKPEIKVVDDEILTPTPTSAIANNTLFLMKSGSKGLFHMTSEGYCSWYEFTKEIFNFLKIKTPLYPYSAKDFPSQIRRPLYSVLENKNLKNLDLNLMPEWKLSLTEFLSNNFLDSLKKVKYT